MESKIKKAIEWKETGNKVLRWVEDRYNSKHKTIDWNLEKRITPRS